MATLHPLYGLLRLITECIYASGQGTFRSQVSASKSSERRVLGSSFSNLMVHSKACSLQCTCKSYWHIWHCTLGHYANSDCSMQYLLLPGIPSGVYVYTAATCYSNRGATGSLPKIAPAHPASVLLLLYPADEGGVEQQAILRGPPAT